MECGREGRSRGERERKKITGENEEGDRMGRERTLEKKSSLNIYQISIISE